MHKPPDPQKNGNGKLQEIRTVLFASCYSNTVIQVTWTRAKQCDKISVHPADLGIVLHRHRQDWQCS